jgi:hypothetical protein
MHASARADRAAEMQYFKVQGPCSMQVCLYLVAKYVKVAASVLTLPHTVTVELTLLWFALMMPAVLLAGVLGFSCTMQLSVAAAAAAA